MADETTPWTDQNIRKRIHPHTRKEWDAVRQEFTDLYQVQKKKLPEIVKLLGEQGFHAGIHHYKTYIRKWGLEKSKKAGRANTHFSKGRKQSDMEFALQKLQQRKTKPTIFNIRGQIRTRHDIEKYWKRKPLNPPPLSPMPATPEGVTYHTPPPALDGALLIIEDDEVFMDDAELPSLPEFIISPEPSLSEWSRCRIMDSAVPGHVIDLDAEQEILHKIKSPLVSTRQTDHFRRIRGMSSFASSSTSWYAIRTPEPFRSQHQALHCAKVYCQKFAESTRFSPDSILSVRGRNTIVDFSNCAISVLAAEEDGLSLATIEFARLETLKHIPALVEFDRPYLLSVLLNVIYRFYSHSRIHRPTSRLLRTVLHEVVNGIVRELLEAHPIAVILTAVLQSADVFLELITSLLSASRQFLQNEHGGDSDESIEVQRTACVIARRSGDYQGALQYAQEIYQFWSFKSKLVEDDDHLLSLLNSQLRLADVHIDLGNYAEAEDLVEDGLRICNTLQSSQCREVKLAALLNLRGFIREFQEDLPAANDSFSEALGLALKLYGPAHYCSIQIAQGLRRVIEKQTGSDHQLYRGSYARGECYGV